MELGNQEIPTVKIKPTANYALYKVFSYCFICLIIIGAGLWFNYPMICLIGIPFLFIALYKYIFILHKVYIIKPEQIIFKKGIFSISKDYIEMYRVQDFDFRQDLIMRLLNVQNIRLVTFDKSQQVVQITGVPASDLIEIIRDRVQNCRKRNKILTMDR